MKKRVLLMAAALALAAGLCTVLPRMVESAIPTAQYITPNARTYENTISCTGTIQSGNVRQIYLQSALVAGEVYVEVGDRVDEGAPLLRVDEGRTADLTGLPLSLVREVSAGSGGAGGIDWTALASAYGLSAVVNGGSGVDAGLLEELLGQTGLLPDAGAGLVVDLPAGGEIAAPISGVVTEVDIQPNIPVAAGKAVVTIADDRSYKVLVAIREEDIARVAVGDSARVRGVGFSGTVYTGTVTKIHPTARKTLSGTSSETVVDAEIALHDGDRRLKPGFSAKVEIAAADADYELITVPYEAIKQDENNSEYVYLYEDGKLKKQVVVTGRELTSEVEILKGVRRDSIVVLSSSDSVREGAMVQIRGKADVD